VADPERPAKSNVTQAKRRNESFDDGALIMTRRSSVHDLWNAARAGLARLKRLLAETGNSDDMIFDIRDASDRWRLDDREPRAVDPRKT
jgi:hypothetical protein